jgi:hypothetical protein
MKSIEKTKPAAARPAQDASRGERGHEAAGSTREDERDLRDALRARAEAEREGSYPWEQLKSEIER